MVRVPELRPNTWEKHHTIPNSRIIDFYYHIARPVHVGELLAGSHLIGFEAVKSGNDHDPIEGSKGIEAVKGRGQARKVSLRALLCLRPKVER